MRMRKLTFRILVAILVVAPNFSFSDESIVWIFPTVSFIQRMNDYDKGFDFLTENYKYYSIHIAGARDYPFIVADDSYIYLRDSIPTARIQKSAIRTEPDSFQSFFDGNKRWPIILGGGYCAVTRILNERFEASIKHLHDAREYLLNHQYESIHYDLLDTSFILPQVIKSVRMSAPFLEETIRGVRYRYDDDMLLYRWFYKYLNRGLVAMYFINDPTPMVEGAPGNGEGLTLDIEYHIPSDNLVVLNGFVDLERRHLYKLNARMKKVLVQGDGFELEYEFQDYVYFAQIDFPKKVNKIRLTVQEVFEGSRYDDLCISGLFTNPDVLNTRNSPLAYELLEEAKKEWQERR